MLSDVDFVIELNSLTWVVPHFDGCVAERRDWYRAWEKGRQKNRHVNTGRKRLESQRQAHLADILIDYCPGLSGKKLSHLQIPLLPKSTKLSLRCC
jgi:hypothetical protein